MRRYLRELFIRKGIYYRIRYSLPFRLYLNLFKRSAIAEERREVEFYRSFLTNCELIFDIGAYDGHKTEAFLKIARSVVCCEPDIQNVSILKSRFRNKADRVQLIPMALSSAPGTAIFHVHEDGSAFNTLNSKWRDLLRESGYERYHESFDQFENTMAVETTTIDALIARFGKPSFIKIDVEGHELETILGLSHRISCLSFECNLPEFQEETIKCLTHLYSLDPALLLNYSIQESLVLESFISLEDFLHILQTINVPCIEIICKMNP